MALVRTEATRGPSPGPPFSSVRSFRNSRSESKVGNPTEPRFFRLPERGNPHQSLSAPTTFCLQSSHPLEFRQRLRQTTHLRRILHFFQKSAGGKSNHL